MLCLRVCKSPKSYYDFLEAQPTQILPGLPRWAALAQIDKCTPRRASHDRWGAERWDGLRIGFACGMSR